MLFLSCPRQARRRLSKFVSKKRLYSRSAFMHAAAAAAASGAQRVCNVVRDAHVPCARQRPAHPPTPAEKHVALLFDYACQAIIHGAWYAAPQLRRPRSFDRRWRGSRPTFAARRPRRRHLALQAPRAHPSLSYPRIQHRSRYTADVQRGAPLLFRT